MKISIRSIGLVTTLGAVVALTGCVAAGPGYYGDSGYGQPYYSDPVVVNPAPIYIEGGGYYGGGSRPYYRQPYYNDDRGRGYRGGYPGNNVRPGYPPRAAVLPAPVQPPRATPGYPRPIAVPPTPGAPRVTVQPSWNNKEQP